MMKDLKISLVLVVLAAIVMLGTSQPNQTCGQYCIAANCTNGTCTLCRQGYGVGSDGKCQPCNQDCNTCTFSAGEPVCSAGGCKSDFKRRNDGKECYKCASPCLDCDQTSQNCTNCPGGYPAVNNTCSMPLGCRAPCLTCNTNGTCITCVNGTFLPNNATDGRCVACRAGCKTCRENGTYACLDCPVGFNLNGNDCQSNPRGCSAVNGSGCTACFFGYWLDGTSCSLCDRSCADCNGTAATCTTCRPPFILSGSSCIRCRPDCNTCTNGTNTCQTCRPPFSYQSSANGSCFRCQDTKCRTCSETNVSVCLECILGARLNATSGTCTPCPPKCQTCDVANGTVRCTRCMEKNVLKDGNCTNCRQGCLACPSSNVTRCDLCQDGTYNDDGFCKRCTRGCATCQNNITCTQLLDGWVIADGQGGVGMLTRCADQGCKRCNPTQIQECQECRLGFVSVTVNNNTNCAPCSRGCVSCSDINTCTRCQDRLKLTNVSTCVRCPNDTCLICDDDMTMCLTCIRGWVIDPNVPGSCMRCPNNCSACSPLDPTKCFRPNPGYAINKDAKIIKCAGGCRGQCDPRNVSVCISCPLGSELRDGKCLPCAPGCLQCQDGICSSCFDRFTLKMVDGNLSCVLQCKSFCETCNATTCTACSTGYTLDANGNCNADLSCNNNCSACVGGTYKQPNGTCVACPTNCASCNPNNCTSCKTGFYLVNNTCTACSADCFDCVDDTICNICNLGWTRQYTDLENDIKKPKCSACQAPCKYCTIDTKTCSECGTNQRMNSTSCLSKIFVAIKIKYSTDYNTFLQNGNSAECASNFSNHSGGRIQHDYTSFDRIKSGSTDVEAALGVPQGESTTSIASAAVTAATLSGATVTSVTIQDENGNTVTDDKKVNVGMIVGVVIGGVAFLVIVGIVIYLVATKKAASATVTHSEQGLKQVNQNDSINYDKH